MNKKNTQDNFSPSKDLLQQSNAKPSLYDFAKIDFVKFWANQARDNISWESDWNRDLNWDNPPFARWFEGGKLNVAYNCVDRHVLDGNGERIAIIWEGEPGDTIKISYRELKDHVSQAANALIELGVKKGDRVIIYLPMVPEAIIAMLACARIGAIHSVVFGGFSVDSVRSRIIDTGAKIVITANGGYRRGKPYMLKPIVDEAVSNIDFIDKILVVKRVNELVAMKKNRDIWWHDTVPKQSIYHECEVMDSEDPLFILYTSGTTGKPKGILHTTGGYITQASFTHKMVFDIKPKTDVYWCTADVGWITGHTYITYGPLSNGATQVIYEGTPDTPNQGRMWSIIEKHNVTIFYTAPTLIRTFMKWGKEIPGRYDLSSLKLLGSVGEPINPSAWLWYRENIGNNKCPIVDTWWQTETGSIMISPLPAITVCKPGSATKPLPGIFANIVDKYGNYVKKGSRGFLTIDKPWPAMARTIWGDDQRFIDTYWKKFGNNKYFVGDSAVLDEDEDFWILGRVDDTMNVSGHLISTSEIESELVAHDLVAEAAVVGVHDDITGERIIAFVIPVDAYDSNHDKDVEQILIKYVADKIGHIAKPKKVYIVPDLPKTRSGKIMRRILRNIADNNAVGDTTTLADPESVSRITQVIAS